MIRMTRNQRLNEWLRLLELAKLAYEWNDEPLSWLRLLEAAEIAWVSNTPRQAEQRKLSSCLFIITGVRGQLEQLKSHATGESLVALNEATAALMRLANEKRHLMSNISERICQS